MWGHHHSTTYGHICPTPTMPCLCTCCHAKSYEHTYNNHHLLPYSQNPLNNPTFHHHDQSMVTNEIDSLLLLNPDHNPLEYDQNFHQYYPDQGTQQVINHHGNSNHGEQQQEQMYDFSRVAFDNTTPTSFLNSTLDNFHLCHMAYKALLFFKASLPEVTPGSYSNTTVDWSRVYEFSFLPFHNGNLIEEVVGSSSNSTTLSLEGKRQPDDELKNTKSFKYTPMSRQDRVLRYFEKKKTRKYEKKLIKYSSRKTYAQTRPRIRGRFARRSQVDE
ncbi:hypothetical protein LXL04_030550 [Taraxacum kok-saghyz]